VQRAVKTLRCDFDITGKFEFDYIRLLYIHLYWYIVHIYIIIIN